MRLTAQFRLESRLRFSGPVTPLPHTPLRCAKEQLYYWDYSTHDSVNRHFVLSQIYHPAEVQYKQRGRVSSVSIVTRLRHARPRNSGSIQGRVRILSALHSIQTSSVFKQLQNLWLPGNPPSSVKHPSFEATHSTTFCAKIKNTWSYTYISSYVLFTRCLGTDIPIRTD